MTKNQQRAPAGLNKPGRALWKWLIANYTTAGCEPLMRELCAAADRLAEIRVVIAREGVIPAEGKGRRHPLLDSEVKLSGQFMRLWRTLGLAKDEPAIRLPGRPSNYEAEQ